MAAVEHDPKALVRRVSFSDHNSTVFVLEDDEGEDTMAACACKLDGFMQCLEHGETCYFHPYVSHF